MEARINDRYSTMQRRVYSEQAGRWSLEDMDPVVGMFNTQNAWGDYREYLFKDIDTAAMSALDFGCGPGRCLVEFSGLFERIDGADISHEVLCCAEKYLQHRGVESELILTNGRDLQAIDAEAYDLVYSTICLQHICVHEIRLSLMREFHRVLRPGGWFTAQMGFGPSHPRSVRYHANAWWAPGTNGALDCRVEDPSEVEQDLRAIGFDNFQHWLRPVGPGDTHDQWIFFRARKP